MNELEGKYLNGYRIAKVEKDPFIEGQINLWTDETKLDFLGNKEVVKFYVRDYPSGASIYQELIDKENYQLKSILNELEKWLEKSIEKHTDDYIDWKYDRNVYLAGSKKLQNVFDKLQELKGVDKE